VDEDLRQLERAAAAGDPAAAERLAAHRARVLRRPDGTRAHHGAWSHHDDDCRCGEFDLHCNRDGFVWSCCGACKQDSECSGAALHPTHWRHPKSGQTHSGWEGVRPTYKSDAEIRAIAPEAFRSNDPS
jgi:hypothetical protein